MNKEKIKKYLEEHLDVAIEVAREINCYNGELSFVDTWDLTELIACYCTDYESTRKFLEDIILNSLDTLPRDIDTPVRFDEYGTYLEAIEDEDLQKETKDYIDEIVDFIEELYPSELELWGQDELKELLKKEFNVEEAAQDVYEEAEKHYKGSEMTPDVLMTVARTEDWFNFNDEELEQLREYFIREDMMNLI